MSGEIKSATDSQSAEQPPPVILPSIKPAVVVEDNKPSNEDTVVAEDTLVVDDKEDAVVAENTVNAKDTVIAKDTVVTVDTVIAKDTVVTEDTVIAKDTVATAVAEGSEVEGISDVKPQNNDTVHADGTTQTNIDLEAAIKNKELKSLMQLSKEANLDTNIMHKRNTLTPEQKDPKRSMRSQNPEFAAKQQSFLTKVAQGHVDSVSDKDEKVDKDEGGSKKRRRDSSFDPLIGGANDSKSKKLLKSAMELVQKNKDGFCWRCHRDGINVSCTTCPRSYHMKCLRNTNAIEHWICPECSSVLTAESIKTRSPALKSIPLGQLCKLLKFALKRMVQINDSEPFVSPVNAEEFPDYKKYIVQPMDFTKLEKNIKANLYGSTKAFEADAKWLLHNSIIFNSYQSKLTTVAKSIIKVCKQEMAEIENCSSCYLNANTKKSWFVEVCPKPHLLVWAKLKGFPYWPAKVMCTNNQGLVDVRFFGAHDRAWVSLKECFLFSIKDPNMNHFKRDEINECIREVEVYIKKLKAIYGRFNYPPYKTPYDAEHELEQLQMFLPDYKLDNKKDTESDTPNKPSNQNREEASDEEEDWEVRKYIEEGKANNSPSPELTPKQRVRSRKTPMHKRYRMPRSEDPSPLKKASRRSSIQSSQSDSGRISSTSDKIAKMDTVESENSKDSSAFDDKKNADLTRDILVPPSGKLKIADKLMKKLVGDDDKEKHETGSVVITSFEASPGKSIIESETESDVGVPTLNDIKQVILGNSSLLNEKENSKKKIEDSISDKLLSKEIDSNAKKSGSRTKKTPKAEAKNKEKVEIKSNEKTETKSRERKAIKARDKNENKLNVTTEVCKLEEKTEYKEEKHQVKSKFKHEVKPKEIMPTKSKDKEVNINLDDRKLQSKKMSDFENSSMEDEESLLEEMYFELVEEQKQKQSTQTTKETTTKNINGASKRKRAASVKEIESPIHSKMVKLVDIDLIKNPKLHPLDLPGNLSSSPFVKEKMASPNKFEGFVEIKHEVESDQESLSDDYIDSPPYIIPKKTIGSGKNAGEKNSSLVINPTCAIQKNVQTSLLKKSQKPITTCAFGPTSSAATSIVTSKITTTTGIDSGSVMFVAQPQAFSNNQIVLPPNQSITYGGNSIFVPQYSNYIIPTTPLNVGTISLNSSSNSNQGETQIPTVKISQSQTPNVLVTKAVEVTVGNTPKTQTHSVLTISKPATTMISTTPTLAVKSQNVAVGATSSNIKSNINQVNKTQSSPNANILSTTRTIQTISSSVSAKLGLNMNATSPKTVAKQLPPLRRATQLPTSAQLIITTIANAVTNNVTVTTNTGTISSASACPPLCSLITSTVTSMTSQTVAVSATSAIVSSMVSTQSNASTMPTTKVDSTDEYDFLTGNVPERLVKALSEITYRSLPPALTPRPQGLLMANLDQGIQSTAGPVATKVNSIAHKLTDYFRGMLVDFLSEFSMQDSSEATIAALKLEIEQLNQIHSLEISEMKKNLQTILKEMQKNFAEERQRIIEETRKTCELEAIKRVDEAKSKQWCSCCMKEAQFYCCWNTSYCDYPCQIEHWPTHMERCTQNIKIERSGSPKQSFIKRTSLTKVAPGNVPHNVTKPPKVYSSPKTLAQTKASTSGVKFQ